MNTRLLVLLLMAAVGAGCSANKTQRSPSLTAPAAAQAPQRNVLKDAGDTTWQVVTAPARFVTPKKAAGREPEVFEAPSAVVVKRGYVDDDDQVSTPAATVPAKGQP